VRFVSMTGILALRTNEVENGTRFFKQWVAKTNGALPKILADRARNDEAAYRERLKHDTLAEEARVDAIKRARNALRS